jgi:hypothetical protein
VFATAFAFAADALPFAERTIPASLEADTALAFAALAALLERTIPASLEADTFFACCATPKRFNAAAGLGAPGTALRGFEDGILAPISSREDALADFGGYGFLAIIAP